jgi:hypothetical protein
MHFKQTKRNVKPETWKTESASPFIHANLKVEKKCMEHFNEKGNGYASCYIDLYSFRISVYK